MKKFLSLVLALVMAMSLVTVSAGAEYADQDSIKYDEAVAVLAADFPQPQSLFIEGDGLFQVSHIVVFMNHFEFHKITSCL